MPLRSNDELISYAIATDNYSEFYRLTDPKMRCVYDTEIKQQQAISIIASLMDSCMNIIDLQLNEGQLRYILDVLPQLSVNPNNRSILEGNIDLLVSRNMNLIISLRDPGIVSQLRRYITDSDLRRFIVPYVRSLNLDRRTTMDITGALIRENKYMSQGILQNLLASGYITPSVYNDLFNIAILL